MTTPDPALSLRQFPHFELGIVAALCLAAVLAAAAPWGFELRLLGAAVALAIAAPFGWIASRRISLLVISPPTMRFVAGRQSVDLPIQAAIAVEIARSERPLREPTRYALRVGGHEGDLILIFDHHRFVGERALRRAHRVARALGVPVRDPDGDRLRATGVTALRWVAEGREWRLLVVAVPIALLVGCAIWALL